RCIQASLGKRPGIASCYTGFIDKEESSGDDTNDEEEEEDEDEEEEEHVSLVDSVPPPVYRT
nr:hypothetical protein [Tanacetum cinerariifolium]